VSSPAGHSDALAAAVSWGCEQYATNHVAIVARAPVEGGISGSTVERVTLTVGRPHSTAEATRVAVVIKHTNRQEIDALTLLADLHEPAIPRLLASGSDAGTYWMLIPWFQGEPVGLVVEPPAEVGALMARIHLRFLDRRAEWPQTFERIDSQFVQRALRDFLPETLTSLPRSAGADAIRARALCCAERLLCDQEFLADLDTFPATVIHGDLYGLNVMRDESGAVMVIDWNAARVGPGMFDIAMGTPSGTSPLAEAYRAEWHRTAGHERALDVELDWSMALVNTMFAGAVAGRGSVNDASAMLDIGEAAHKRLHH